ncbi:sigma-70 family RNA polymerase sigma factor [Brevundimonas naejangsanensis]|uniref:RNA polymerase sigma factor n=2 Tax=Brevundimonas naejangsanensis TaxID=588932 RepID=A0A494RID7_9CAUL|nr:sigma-70 family RNA polymerase sigma factor [Brevundimonas naejangsanensis]
MPEGPHAIEPPSHSPDPTGSPDLAVPGNWRGMLAQQIPALRAFAFSLARNRADADDLVQETLVKAWAHRTRFEAGTNLRAWLFTILRNSWYTGAAKRRREVADEEGRHAAGLTAEASQEWTAELTALQGALNTLPPEHREAIIMVGAAGLSYQEAADIAGCAVGTIKSRVNRARRRLALLLAHEIPLEAKENKEDDDS